MEYFFDPSCPWTWITSRWLVDEAGRRDAAIVWRSFPLANTNDGPPPPEDAEPQRMSTAFQRVAEALRADGRNPEIGALYAAVGEHVHERGGDATPGIVGIACDAIGLDPSVAAAADDERWDAAIDASYEEARALVGDDVGSPVLAMDAPSANGGADGNRVAMFGPILSARPDEAAAARLWDAVTTFIAVPEAAELKRGRGITTPLDRVGGG